MYSNAKYMHFLILKRVGKEDASQGKDYMAIVWGRDMGIEKEKEELKERTKMKMNALYYCIQGKR